MDTNKIEDFCTALIQEDILPILQGNYRKLFESAQKNGSAFFKQEGAVASFKDDGKGLVSEGEIEAERILREKFKAEYPDFAIFGEELGDEQSAENILVIDPVDGTSAMIANAIAHNPDLGFGITLGFLHKGAFYGGLIYELTPDHRGNLTLGDIWSGWQGQQTRYNDEQISCLEAKDFETLYATAPEVMFKTPQERSGFHALEQAAANTITNRNCMGFMDAILEEGACAIEADLSIHDAAALIPILKGANMRVTDHSGADIKFENAGAEFKILTAPPALHTKALEIYKTALGEKPLAIDETSVLNNAASLNTSKF